MRSGRRAVRLTRREKVLGERPSLRQGSVRAASGRLEAWGGWMARRAARLCSRRPYHHAAGRATARAAARGRARPGATSPRPDYRSRSASPVAAGDLGSGRRVGAYHRECTRRVQADARCSTLLPKVAEARRPSPGALTDVQRTSVPGPNRCRNREPSFPSGVGASRGRRVPDVRSPSDPVAARAGALCPLPGSWVRPADDRKGRKASGP
jgi:hypothetical protein